MNMKTKLTIFLITLISFFGFAQDLSFDKLKDKSKTDILYNRVFSVSNATNLKTSRVNSNYFIQVYHEMQRADFKSRMPKLEFVRKEAEKGLIENIVPLSILITDFENIKTSAFESKLVVQNADNNYSSDANSEQIFDVHQINLLSPIVEKTKENKPTFLLKKELVFNTSKRIISEIQIYNNGNWMSVSQDIPFQLSFDKNGIHEVKYRLHFENGEVLQQSFQINVQHQNKITSNKSYRLLPNVVQTIASTIPYQGYGETAAFIGEGEFEIFPDTVNGILDKPIILVDGFDPGDTRNTTAIYQLLNYGTSGQNLGDLVRAQGYDIVVLNFPQYTRTGTSTIIDGGADYIQRNAMILVELLNQINAQKTGTEKNVVIGPSMGGLISRYALRYMEQNSLNHDTRLYLSFDSPHLGANVPIGFQHLFNYMAYGPIGETTLQTIVDGMLKSPAAREMLLDHFEGHLASGSAYEFNTNITLPTGCPNYRTAFQSELNSMGFPQNTRNIAITNGAGNGTSNGTPGMEVMNHTFNTSSTQRAIININYTPVADQTIDVSHFRGQQWIFVWFTVYESFAKSKSPATSAGLDTAPGGKFDLSGFAESTTGSPLIDEFFQNLQTNYFSFIPATSALAITSTNNYYSPVSSGLNTPFVTFYTPTANENHVTLQDQNVAYALNEILNWNTLQTTEFDADQIWIENPVKNSLKIRSNKFLKNADITIIDITGKSIFSKKNIEISGEIELPISLPRGNYMVTINNKNQKITKKIIIE